MKLKHILSIIESEILQELENISLVESRKITEKTVPVVHKDFDRKGEPGVGRIVGKKGSDGYADRDSIGKKLLADPKAVAKFKSKHGKDWESYLWATASDIVARKKHGGSPKGGKKKKQAPADSSAPAKDTPAKKSKSAKSKGYKKPRVARAKQSKDPSQTSLDLK